MTGFLRIGKWLLGAIGFIATICVVLAFTDLPYHAYHQLGTSCQPLEDSPKVIVVLGGSGMPSPDGLIRTYYAAEAALKYPDATIIIAHPAENQNTKQLDLMKHELVIRGIDSTRVRYEPEGFNTRSQAVNVAHKLQDKLHAPVLIITAPEHMFRSIKTFQKTGFTHVGGLPSFEKPLEEQELLGEHAQDEIGLPWRYNFWSYLRYEILVMREYCAIGYYWLKGWM